MKGQMMIILEEDKEGNEKFKLNAPKNKILAYGMLLYAFETLMKNPPKKVVVQNLLPPMNIKPS